MVHLRSLNNLQFAITGSNMPSPDTSQDTIVKGTKQCFVIGPIGQKGSSTRRQADWLLKYVIIPVLKSPPFSYEVFRADDKADPGSISAQVINAILECDLVIADLAGHNANAFYELGIRHMTSKPTIHLFHANEGLPFDVRDYRGIEYKLDETDDVEDAKIRLAEQVRAVEKAEFRVSTPVTSALTYKNLVLSADPKDKMVADLADDIRRIELKVAQLESSTHARFSEIRRGIYRELRLPGEFGKDTAASARLGQTANTYRGAEEPTTMDINEEEFRDVWLERRHFK